MPKSPTPATKAAQAAPKELRLGPVTLQRGGEASATATRMAFLIWGPPGVGKTTYAATAPGIKLWLSFGDNEHATVAGRDDVLIADLSGYTPTQLFQQAQSSNPFGLEELLEAHTEIETVVVDSVTAIAYLALLKAISDKVGRSRDFTPSVATPGLSAYGARNGITLEVLTGILRVTAKFGVHVVMIAHEADPVMKKENGQTLDVIDYVTIQLGGQLVNNTTWRLSEIWYLGSTTLKGGYRYVRTQPGRNRKPMKSRMFKGSAKGEFRMTYDADDPDPNDPTTINALYERWRDGGWKKLSPPGTVVEEEGEEG